MRFRLLATMVVAIAVLAAVACSGGGDDAPTPAPATHTAAPSPTATPNVYLTPASGFLCPVADSAACRLAIDLQTAMDAKDYAAIAAKLVAARQPCNTVRPLDGEDIGCANPAATSLPVVRWQAFGSDCCAVLPLTFAARLALLIDASPGGWRVAGIVQNTPLWPSRYAILISAGPPSDGPLLEFGLSGEQSGKIAGALVAPAGPPYVHPDALLVPWP